MSTNIKPGAKAALDAVSLSTGSESAYVLCGTLVVTEPGLIILQGDVGSGLALGGLKFTRSLVEGGSEVALASDATIETAGPARGIVDAVGDGTHAVYQTALSSSWQALLLWHAPGVLNVYAKRADNSAATTLAVSASMAALPPSVPMTLSLDTVDDLTVAGDLVVDGTSTFTGATTHTGAAAFNEHVTIGNAKNIVLNTGTGTKIGTGVTQKLGFWNVTPVVQPAGATQAALTDNSTGASGGNTIAAVTNTATAADAIATLAAKVNVLRAALVTLGLIKGAA